MKDGQQYACLLVEERWKSVFRLTDRPIPSRSFVGLGS